MYPHFLPEGELITAAVSERKVEIWQVEKDEKLDEFEHRGNSKTAHFSDCGTQLAVPSRSEIKIWTKGGNSDAHTRFNPSRTYPYDGYVSLFGG